MLHEEGGGVGEGGRGGAAAAGFERRDARRRHRRPLVHVDRAGEHRDGARDVVPEQAVRRACYAGRDGPPEVEAHPRKRPPAVHGGLDQRAQRAAVLNPAQCMESVACV